MTDERGALARACELARRGLGDVEPNPMVGAVVLDGQEIVGEGWHRMFGGPHAEVEALADAGERARGATVVVTLEPCSTRGKTGPCTEALIAAGVRRVVVGAVDPNPEHAGRGLDVLREAGVEVEMVDDGESRALLERFERSLTSRRPHVFAKWAMSRDGYIAGPGGEPVAISGQESRARVHEWRAALDAIVVGVGTVVSDDPQLTARGDVPALRPLRRVVLDPTLRTPVGTRLVTTAGGVPTWIFGTDDADGERQRALEEEGVRVLRVPGGDAWLEGVLETLHLHGVRRLMIEGGARTLARAFDAGVVDHVAVFVARRRLGPGSVPAIEGRELGELEPQETAEQLGLVDVSVEQSAVDRLVRGFVR